MNIISHIVIEMLDALLGKDIFVMIISEDFKTRLIKAYDEDPI